ncbi:phosphotransferase family protein [Nocardia sp. NPDC057668]|uniref:phosphotransferase family protein n=1 Tax=Nocardia sp. NPDC057668 TaxID=3346202 RepID=UPI003672A3E4
MSMDPADSVLRRACAVAGVDCANATVLNRSENILYRLDGAIVARIARSGQESAARREVAVAEWLEAEGISAVRTVPGLDQPVVVEQHAVTFWKELPPHRPGTPAQIAGALRQLHALSLPVGIELGELDPFVRLDQRIDGAITVSSTDRDWMRDHLAELRKRWDERPSGLPRCVVHGDAWSGNVVATDDGTIVMLDLERTSVGPPEWDTVHTAIKFKTLGQISAQAYQSFCEVYGSDVTEWEGYELLRDLREFRMTTMAAQSAANIPADREQADHRIACLQGKFGPRPWSGWHPVPSR